MKKLDAALLPTLLCMAPDARSYYSGGVVCPRPILIQLQPCGPSLSVWWNRPNQAQKNFKQAEHCYQRVLAIDEKVYGSDHSELATDLQASAQLLLAMKRDKEAAQLLDRAQCIQKTNNNTLHNEKSSR